MDKNRTYYSLTEVANMLNLPKSTITHWDKKFDQLSIRRDKHGNRYFTSDNIDLLKKIKYLRDELHITRHEAIRNELLNNFKQTNTKQQVFDIILEVKDELKKLEQLI